MFSVQQSTELVITPARCDNKIHDDFAFSACPFLFLKKILPSPSIPQRKPNPQYFHKTWLRLMNIMLSVKADQLYRRTAFMRSRKLIWAAESRDGAEQKGTELGESKAQTVLAASSYLLTVSSHSTDLWTGWASALPYLFFPLRISGNLVNYYTGESEALQPRQSPVAGKWCKLPTSHQPRSANPPLLWPVSIPSLPPQPRDPALGHWGPRLGSCVLLCSRQYLPGDKGYFSFEKSLQWTSKCLSV